MVAPPLQLCFELGYHDWSEFPSRGPAKLLLDDLKVFVEDRSTSESVESLSAAYLAAKPAGLKHEPGRNDCQLAGLLAWPRDRLMLVHDGESCFGDTLKSEQHHRLTIAVVCICHGGSRSSNTDR